MSDTTALELQKPQQMATFTEQSTSMMEQLATAQIQSRYAIAMRFPRNVEQTRLDMLKECSRPSFCLPDPTKNGSSLAIYAVPRGGTIIRGCSIRFAEMAARAWKNLSVDVVPIGEDKNQRIFQVTATDFEANITGSQIVTVPKTVERQNNPDNKPVLSQRTNSYGKTVYTLEATEDEISMNAQRLISKARRNLILQCIPGWLIEECIDQVKETAQKKDAEDPDAARRRIFDAYASVGVSAQQLTDYIGHTNAFTPAEMDNLRGFFSAIREGAATWKQIVDAKNEDGTIDATTEKIDELLVTLEYTEARARNIKAKHVGQAEKLLKYLEAELAKKQNDGGRKEEPSASDPTQAQSSTTAQTVTSQAPKTNGKTTSQQTNPSTMQEAASPSTNPTTHSQDTSKTAEQTEHRPAPQAQPKKMPPAINTRGW